MGGGILAQLTPVVGGGTRRHRRPPPLLPPARPRVQRHSRRLRAPTAWPPRRLPPGVASRHRVRAPRSPVRWHRNGPVRHAGAPQGREAWTAPPISPPSAYRSVVRLGRASVPARGPGRVCFAGAAATERCGDRGGQLERGPSTDAVFTTGVQESFAGGRPPRGLPGQSPRTSFSGMGGRGGSDQVARAKDPRPPLVVAVVALVAVAAATIALSSAPPPGSSSPDAGDAAGRRRARRLRPRRPAIGNGDPGVRRWGVALLPPPTRRGARRGHAVARSTTSSAPGRRQTLRPHSRIKLSSPNVATVNGARAVVVGDRGGNVLAYDLGDGAVAWPQSVRIVTPATGGRGVPIDSTPSVDAAGDLFVGAGNAAYPDLPGGGYYGFSSIGVLLWHASVDDPDTDTVPATGVQASLTVATQGGAPSVVAGSLDQEGYALAASTGAVEPGWPFFDSDSVFSTAAADRPLRHRGRRVDRGGIADGRLRCNGQLYATGGHLRALSGSGQLDLPLRLDPGDQLLAGGGRLPGGWRKPGIVFGTGDTFPGAPADRRPDLPCDGWSSAGRKWQTTLGGLTSSSPALADVTGTGQLGCGGGGGGARGRTGAYVLTGAVYVVDAATGVVKWPVSPAGRRHRGR